MEKALHDRNYSSFICNTTYARDRCESYITELRRRNVDGIAVVGTTPLGTTELIGNIPCVLVDYYDPWRPANSCLIVSDLFMLTASQLSCLEEHGCTATAVITLNAHDGEYLDAFETSFVTKLSERSPGRRLHTSLHDPALTIFVPIEQHSTAENFKKLVKQELSRHPQIDGIATIGDRTAMFVCDTIEEMGLTPGKDILVIGADNSIYSSVHTPKISTVDRNRHLMARAATGALLALMEGREPAVRSITIPHRVVERETTLGEGR